MEEHSLDGRVALVTGASRGIGRAIALALAESGAAVAVNYRQSSDLAAAVVSEIEAAGGRALACQADVSQPDECRRLVEIVTAEFGVPDVLVNNAGINRDHQLHRMTVDEWRQVIESNLSSAFYLTSLVVDSMRERQWGRIVNIGSLLGQTGSFGQANYAASKAGLAALTRSAALELARFNVTANVVNAGYVETDMFAQASDEFRASVLQQIPLGRFGRPEEVAALVRFLVTEADWMTGQELDLNGGQLM